MSKTCKCGYLEEIHGFSSLIEYERFKEYLNRQIQNKNLRKVDTDIEYEKGLIYGGEWYKCVTCGEIWRLVEPDIPFKGLWEKVVK